MREVAKIAGAMGRKMYRRQGSEEPASGGARMAQH